MYPWQNFILGLCEHFAWPASLLFVVIYFRIEIKDILTRTEVLPWGWKLSNSKKLEEMKKYIREQEKIKSNKNIITKIDSIDSEENARYEFLQKFTEMEIQIRRICNKLYPGVRVSLSVAMRKLALDDYISKENVSLINDIIPIRNRIVHEGLKIDYNTNLVFLKYISLITNNLKQAEKSLNDN